MTVPLALFYVALAGIGACTRRRPTGALAVLRLATAMAVAVVGVAAWWIPWIHMEEALPILTVVAIVHAFAVLGTRESALAPRPGLTIS